MTRVDGPLLITMIFISVLNKQKPAEGGFFKFGRTFKVGDKPRFETVAKVMKALNLDLKAAAHAGT